MTGQGSTVGSYFDAEALEYVRERERQPSFVAQKMLEQARGFTMPQLEEIYHYLLDIDQGIKTGKFDIEMALDLLIASLAA